MVGKDELIRCICTDTAEDTEPTPRPSENNILLLPNMLCELWHRTDVSDSHVDRSHAVCESRTADVYVASPMLPPCSVTLAEPVAARFVRDDTLNIPT